MNGCWLYDVLPRPAIFLITLIYIKFQMLENFLTTVI